MNTLDESVEYFPSPSNATEVLHIMTNLPDCSNSILQDISYPTSPLSSNLEKQLDKSPYSNNAKYGSYKPMTWTIETMLNLLHTTNDGRYILADSVKNSGNLSDDSKNLLTQLLINHLLQDQHKGNDLFFRKITELIVEVFPKEQKSVYFIPSKTEGSHQTHAKGKLIERWKNVARRLRCVGAISYDRVKPSKTVNTISQSIHFSDEVLEVKKWLISYGLNFNLYDIRDKWEFTFNLRKNDIFDLTSLSDVFKAWPIFQGPNSYELILEDFKIGYQKTNTHEDFKNSWEKFSKRLIEIRKSSIKDKHALTLLKRLDSSNLNGDLMTSNIIRILLVPYLIPTKTQIKNCSSNARNKFWKPSLFESALAFATHVTNITNFNEDFTQRQNRYSEYGATIQPYIVFVGPDIESISSIYVRIDEHFWCFECPLKALEVCFKSYFVFHRSYPKESHDSWLVIQQLLFKLNTEYDRPTSITTTVIGMFE